MDSFDTKVAGSHSHQPNDLLRLSWSIILAMWSTTRHSYGSPGRTIALPGTRSMFSSCAFGGELVP